MKNPIESYISYTLAAAHRAVHQSLTAALKEHGVQVEVWRVLEPRKMAKYFVVSKEMMPT